MEPSVIPTKTACDPLFPHTTPLSRLTFSSFCYNPFLKLSLQSDSTFTSPHRDLPTLTFSHADSSAYADPPKPVSSLADPLLRLLFPQLGGTKTALLS